MEEFLTVLGITGPVALILLGIYLGINLVGELCELKGKIVPEFVKIRKFFIRKKKEKAENQAIIKEVKSLLEERKQLLEEKTDREDILSDVKVLLTDVNSHYSADNIAKRDEWMKWVNDRAKIYDASVKELNDLHEALLSNNKLVLDLYINVNRNRIIDFASKVANEDIIMSREEFNRIFKVYKEYEDVLEQHHLTNGEVDIAYKVIEEAYKERLHDNNFLEDIRGYNK